MNRLVAELDTRVLEFNRLFPPKKTKKKTLKDHTSLILTFCVLRCNRFNHRSLPFMLKRCVKTLYNTVKLLGFAVYLI